ncbi:amidohydrolase [Streptomyces heilongjiangensis]|uniref:Amidohydrolase n=1 Tax=Streptomyces heilongjiangensis TaxID=945052 RepID=A0ABW1BJA8_9ACTN|nr:amidohydrolase [Streptomyces heilongjiangensis]MDC2952447.1 amidohydrolase [Streptomyces heilongjiangensis]
MSPVPQTPADLILRNGRVYTLDDVSPMVSALAVRDGVLTAAGDEASVASLRGPDTRIVDLGGRFVMPGLVDVHAHPYMAGRAELRELIVHPALGLDDVLAAVRERAAHTAAGEWILGGSVGSHLLTGLDGTALAALDAAAGDHPVMLRDDSVHNRWLNTHALHLAGISSSTPDPEGGRIERDPATGEPVGLLVEGAAALAERAAAAGTSVESDAACLTRAVEILHSFGVTSFQDAATPLPVLRALKHLDDADRLHAWVVASLPLNDPYTGSDPVGEELFVLRERFRGRHVRPDFIKIFLDGVPTSRTAAFLDPYLPDAHGRCGHGGTNFSPEELSSLLVKCAADGLSTKIHCVGDAAVRQALDAIEAVRRHAPDTAVLFQIAHGEFIDPADVSRLAALDVVADLSPALWFPGPIHQAIREQVPEPRAGRMCPNRDLADAGVLLAGGSDWPVMPSPNPWVGIEGLVTRQDPTGRFPGVLWPEQALRLDEALALHTRDAAEAMGIADLTGSLRPGKSADLIVLDRDPFDTAPDALADTVVLETYFAGRSVYRAC